MGSNEGAEYALSESTTEDIAIARKRVVAILLKFLNAVTDYQGTTEKYMALSGRSEATDSSVCKQIAAQAV